jgi:hypothetical protein
VSQLNEQLQRKEELILRSHASSDKDSALLHQKLQFFEKENKALNEKEESLI